MRLLTFIFIIIILRLPAQHSNNYIQYMFNGVLINPAYCGSQNAVNITGMYRHQWTLINGSPVSKTFSCHGPLKNKKLNLGVTVENETFGVFDHTRVNLMYAYRIRLGEGKLAFGLQSGVESYSTNWNKVVTTRNDDPVYAIGSTRKTSFIAGTGAYYDTRNYYIGLSLPQLINNGLAKFPLVILNAGMLINASSDFKIKPAVIVKYITDSPVAANITSTFYYGQVVGFGLGYSNTNQFMTLIDIRVNDQLRFGYGYDLFVNKLNVYTGGSHEVMLRYLLSYKVKAVSARYF